MSLSTGISVSCYLLDLSAIVRDRININCKSGGNLRPHVIKIDSTDVIRLLGIGGFQDRE